MTRFNIHFVYTTPIIFDDTDFERGVGGCESILILGTRALAAAGHRVTVYAHCRASHMSSGVWWQPLETWDPLIPADVTVAFRCPEVLSTRVVSDVRTVLLGDRRCPGLAYALAAGHVDLVIAASNFQRTEVCRQEGIVPDERWLVIPYGTELSAYERPNPKVPGQCYYASAPYRGLTVLLDLWPEIKRQVPHSQLIVSSSYLLWGVSSEENARRNHDLYKRMHSLEPLGVTNVISLPRNPFVQLQLESELLLYPATYDEAFCISALEACAAGAIPILSTRGALPERVVDRETGLLIPGDPNEASFRRRFIAETVRLLRSPDLRQQMSESARQSTLDFSYDLVTSRWTAAWQSRMTKTL